MYANRLCTVGSGGAGYPGHFDQAVRLQGENAPVVWVPSAFVPGLEEERLIDLGPHQHRAGRGEPAIA